MAGEGEIGYKWEITDYEKYQQFKPGQFIQSPKFSIGTHSWLLRLYPCGIAKQANIKNAISVVAQNKVMAYYSLTILNLGGEVLMESFCKGNIQLDAGSGWIVTNLIEASNAGNNFVISCEIKMDNPKINIEQQLERFKQFINNEQLSDVKFVVDGKQLHAHKVILASSSEVFAAMFQHEMKENAENVVEIKDTSYEVLHELFRFIYSCNYLKIKEITKELLIAADKYQVLELKSICEQQLCGELSINNAIDYLSFSDTHGAVLLKKSAINFMVNNMEKIIELKEFDAFMNLEVTVVKDVFRELLARSELKPIQSKRKKPKLFLSEEEIDQTLEEIDRTIDMNNRVFGDYIIDSE